MGQTSEVGRLTRKAENRLPQAWSMYQRNVPATMLTSIANLVSPPKRVWFERQTSDVQAA